MTLSPLISHCLGDTRIGFASLFRPFGSWRESVQSLLSSLYDVCRLQIFQSFQPKTGSFCFTMPELPRLYNLVILTPDNFQRVFMRDWVFNCNQWNICIHQQLEKLRAFAHIFPKVALFKPTHARIAKARTRRMTYHHVPSIIETFKNIAFYMPFRVSTRTILNIRAKSLMSAFTEGNTNGLTFFTRYKYFHGLFIHQNKQRIIATSLQFQRGNT